jgi:hypothetical protein
MNFSQRFPYALATENFRVMQDAARYNRAKTPPSFNRAA